jgi:hypothetical protein
LELFFKKLYKIIDSLNHFKGSVLPFFTELLLQKNKYFVEYFLWLRKNSLFFVNFKPVLFYYKYSLVYKNLRKIIKINSNQIKIILILIRKKKNIYFSESHNFFYHNYFLFNSFSTWTLIYDRNIRFFPTAELVHKIKKKYNLYYLYYSYFFFYKIFFFPPFL